MSGTRQNAFFDVYVIGPHGDWSMVALVVHGALVSMVEGGYEQGAALGTYLRAKNQDIQTVVGPMEAVRGVVERLMPQGFEPRVLQDQQVMAMAVSHLQPSAVEGGDLGLRQAIMEDIPKLTVAALAMHEEEIGVSNTEADMDALMRSTFQKVREGRAWLLADPQGEVIFKASISLPNPYVAQIEGVWTHPQARGRGIAFRCMEQLCAELAQNYELLSLTVGAQNLPAVRLYERLGFEAVDAWRTVYLDEET